MSSQYIPNKPAWLTDNEWDFLLDRDHRQCFRRKACLEEKGSAAPCSLRLNLDHRQPLALGGDNSFANVRLACDGWNRGREVRPDDYWARTGWFDTEFFPRELREIQLIAGYDQFVDKPSSRILINGNDEAARFRDRLLATTTLIPGATGIGKTILTLGTLFGINSVVNRVGAWLPRVLHVLWLSPDTTLRDHTAVELTDEPLELGLTTRPAVVNIAKSFAQLLKGPMGADITVACPQSMWEVDKKTDRPTHSDSDVRGVLSMWDVVVVDECDFANEQVKRVCQLASHALKFWATASPMRDGGFLQDCVLITADAVADYSRARTLDQCLKVLSPEISSVANYEGYEAFIRTSRETISADSGVGRDHVAFMAAVLTIVQQADNLERRMQREAPDEWYSPHVIVRLERIDEINALVKDLPIMLRRMKDNGALKGEGWNVEAVFHGSKNVGLGEKSGGQYLHPFLLARNTRGRATPKSARILLMAEIGKRGINNWPISFVVDTTSNTSVIEMIQFNIGRPIRWPDRLGSWLSDESKSDFVATTVVCLSDLVEDKQKAYEAAYKFVIQQRELLADAGFPTWEELADGREVQRHEINIDPTGTPFTDADRIGIRVGLGKAIEASTEIDEATISQIVSSLIPSATGDRYKKAASYAKRLVEDPDFRKGEVPFGNSADDSAIGVIAKLKPQSDYDSASLIRFVQWEESFGPKRSLYVRALEEDNELIKDAVSRDLRRINEHNYREIEKSEPLSKVVRTITSELMHDLGRYKALSPAATFGHVASAIYAAAKDLFGMEDVDASDDGPMDKRPYHVAMQVRYRRKVKEMATGRLAERGMIPSYSLLRNFR